MIEVIHSVSVMNRAGQETLLMNLMRNIDRTKVHFSFLCSHHENGDYDKEIKQLGGDIYYLGKSLLSRLSYLQYIDEIIENYIFFRKHPKFDILHIHNYHAFTAFLQVLGAKLGGCKHIIVHSHNSCAPHPALHRVFTKILSLFKIERYACSKAAAVWMFENKSDEAYVLNNGIIPDMFKYNKSARQHVRKELGLSDSDFVIGHIGRFNYQKNHIQLLDIFNEVYAEDKHARLVLIGRGELEEDIFSQIKELGLNDVVLSLGIREDIPDVLSAFDLFLFPSLFEGLGIVIIEAEAAGLPCVISDVIPKEVDITSNIYRLPLSASNQIWANQILELQNFVRKDTSFLISKNRYDIRDIARDLGEKYSEIVENYSE